MIKVLLVNSSKAYIPEIPAYINHFKKNPNFSFYDSFGIRDYKISDFDVIWHFMGIDTVRTNRFVVHEYASLSTKPFARLKNLIKKTVNSKPNLRLFLNERIQKEFGFNDRVPFIFRDMGIDGSFYIRNGQKDFDFVYVGTIDKNRRIVKLLDAFRKNLNSKTLLVIGKVPPEILNEFGKQSNITFSGQVGYTDVARYASKARYGINYIPDIYPYNLQTSTKLLEYCAMGLKIVTTSYEWVDRFEKANNARFFRIDPELKDLKEPNIDKFDFLTPDVSRFSWGDIINSSGIAEHLLKNISRG